MEEEGRKDGVHDDDEAEGERMKCRKSRKREKIVESECGNVGKELLLVMKWRCWVEYVRHSITAAA